MRVILNVKYNNILADRQKSQKEIKNKDQRDRLKILINID